jgi:hypothetical protein
MVQLDLIAALKRPQEIMNIEMKYCKIRYLPSVPYANPIKRDDNL